MFPEVRLSLDYIYIALDLTSQNVYLLQFKENRFQSPTKNILCNIPVLSKLDFCNVVYGPYLEYADQRKRSFLSHLEPITSLQ